MIEKIEIAGIATYCGTAGVLGNLSTFNYCYGANGCGKTTISRVISDPGHPDHGHCNVVWKSGNSMEALVYNSDFVERHFRAADELPGIFTLGEQDASILDRIKVAKETRDRLTGEIANLNRSLVGDDGNGGKTSELAVVDDAFKDACWQAKSTLGETLRKAFEGTLNAKEKFKAKLLQEHASNSATTIPISELTERASTVFDDNASVLPKLTSLDWSDLIAAESTEVWGKRVIGKGDVDIAELIQKLGSSDWVKAGQEYLSESSPRCPFCQQDAPATLGNQLASYFDETFEKDTVAIATAATDYDSETNAIRQTLEGIASSESSFIDSKLLAAKIKQFENLVASNKLLIDKKQKEPSKKIAIKTSETVLAEIGLLVERANTQIDEHNTAVNDQANQRVLLRDQTWRHLLDVSLAGDVDKYVKKSEGIKKGIENLKKQISDRETEIRKTDQEIVELEKTTTSIQPTIDGINGLLRSFGFHGFSLAAAATDRCYKLVREDGTDAQQTLSEGEKTFVTFLYFYHLLRGSASESGMTQDRVVVIDDPVSSLDSDILFIVSTLIRKLCDEVRGATGSIKQVFVLTHNVYFHKEVTYSSKRGPDALNEETFWTIRKRNGQSEVVSHRSNPIKSSYELLWADIRERGTGNLSVQNSMRRILESYFKILGGINLDKLQDCFEGNEKLACRSLASWINDGSHSAHDDLYVAVEDSTVDLYFDVFRRIFENTNHLEHYNMMMGNVPDDEVVVD